MDEKDGGAAPAPVVAPAPRRRRIDLRHTKRRKERFLTTLAETYDVGAACAAAGLDWAIMCRLRADDPDFAARWEAVIAAGYDRLEAMLLCRAGAGREEGDVTLARELLRQRAGRKSEAGARRAAPKPPNREKMIADVMEKLTAPPRCAAEPGNAGYGHGGMAEVAEQAGGAAGPS
jgi:hypothetical protein